MKILAMLATATILVGCGVRAQSVSQSKDVIHPQNVTQQMNTFWLKDSPLLKGFVQSKSVPRNFAPMYENPPYATAVINARYFRGWTEVRYSVLLFPDEKALRKWDTAMSTSAQGWFSPLQRPKDKRGVRSICLGGVYRRGKAQPSANVVNRVLIAIYPVQHATQAQGALSDKAFIRLIDDITDELIVRARNLPANQG